jgi:hypothetical protein
VLERKLISMKSLKGDYFHAEVFRDSIMGQADSFSLMITLKPGLKMKMMRLPKLRYLDIVCTDKNFIIHLNNERLRLLFNDFIFGLMDRFYPSMILDDLAIVIENSVIGLVRLAEREMEMSLESAMGLYGELMELRNNIKRMVTPAEALRGWQRPSPANHDFDYEGFSTEVKCVSKSGSAVKISSVYQLQAQPDKKLYLQVYRLDCIKSSDEDSIGEIYNEICKDILPPNLVNDFTSKCEENGNHYGGPAIQAINYKFVVLESVTFDTNSDLFPRVHRSGVHPAISDISYSIDLSALEPFKIQLK